MVGFSLRSESLPVAGKPGESQVFDVRFETGSAGGRETIRAINHAVRRRSGDPPLVATALLKALEAKQRESDGQWVRSEVEGLDENLLHEWGAERLYDPARKAWVDSPDRLRSLLALEARHLRGWVERYLALHPHRTVKTKGGERRQPASPTALLLKEPPAVVERVQAHLVHVGMGFQTAWSVSKRAPHPWRAGLTRGARERRQAKPKWVVQMMGLQGVYRTTDFLAVAWLELTELLDIGAALARCQDCEKEWVYFPQRPKPIRGHPRTVRCTHCEATLGERRPRSKHPEYQRLLMAVRNAKLPQAREQSRRALEEFRRSMGISVKR